MPIVLDAGAIENISFIFLVAIPLKISTALYEAALVKNFTINPEPIVTRPDVRPAL